MAEFRKDVRNTTVKQILNMIDGMDEMVGERTDRIEMQMVRSQSADIASGFLQGDGVVGDLNILLMNVESLRQGFNDALDAIELVAKGAKKAHHDHEELVLNSYTGDATDITE